MTQETINSLITYQDRSLSIADLIEAMSIFPSKLLRLNRGSLEAGKPADIAVFDLDNAFIFRKDQMLSKARNTPFDGYELYGETMLTIAGGRITYEKLC